MHYPRCRREHPPQANSCLGWGGRSALTRVQWDPQFPTHAMFRLERSHPVSIRTAGPPQFTAPAPCIPTHLTRKILSTQTVLRGERQQVAIRVVGVKGSMELPADRSPKKKAASFCITRRRP